MTAPETVVLIGGRAELATAFAAAGLAVAGPDATGPDAGGCLAAVVGVPAAVTASGGADLTALGAALDEAAAARPRLLVLTGMVPPGTTRELAARHLPGVPAAYSPDPALVGGRRLVGGVDAASVESGAALFGRPGGPVTRIGSAEAAELAGLLPAVTDSIRQAAAREWAAVCAAAGADFGEATAGLTGWGHGPGGRTPEVALLAWGARRLGAATPLADRADELNTDGPAAVAAAVADALNARGQPVRAGRVVLVGPDDPAAREVTTRLVARGAEVARFDATPDELASADVFVLLAPPPVADRARLAACDRPVVPAFAPAG